MSLTACEGGEVCPQYSHLSNEAQIIDLFNEYSLSDYYVSGSVQCWNSGKSCMGHVLLELTVNRDKGNKQSYDTVHYML